MELTETQMPRSTTIKAKPIRTKAFRNAREFLSLSDADRERIFQSYSREIPFSETRAMTPDERREWKARQARLQAGHEKPTGKPRPGRPVIGRGTKSVLVSVERDLLKQADAYAKLHGLKRTQLVAAGLRLAMAQGVKG